MDRTRSIKSIDEFINIAKELRGNAEAAEASFLLFLREFELQREDLWKVTGTISFDGFLQSAQLCNVARYRNFVAGSAVVQESSERIGASATVAAGAFKAPTAEAAREFVSRCEKFREVHEVAPSEQTARTWVNQLDQHQPKVVRQANRMRQLEAENQQLRAENRELERKLKAAEKEIAKLRGSKLRKGRGAPAAAEATA